MDAVATPMNGYGKTCEVRLCVNSPYTAGMSNPAGSMLQAYVGDATIAIAIMPCGTASPTAVITRSFNAEFLIAREPERE